MISIGDKFDKLEVKEIAGKREHNREKIFLCQCDCGNFTKVRAYYLTSKHTTSCGCLRAEIMRAVATKHGLSKSKEHRIWLDMRKRCLDKNRKAYKDYGGRGIKICDEWIDNFPKFLEDMGKCPDGYSLDRKNNNGNYEKNNCRWATILEQVRNRRNTVKLTYNNETKSLAEWAEIYNFKIGTLAKRIRDGWTVEEALTMPKIKGRPKISPRGSTNDSQENQESSTEACRISPDIS